MGFFLFWGGWVFFFPVAILFLSVTVADFILHLLGKELTVCIWIARAAGENFTLCSAMCLFPSQLLCLYYL